MNEGFKEILLYLIKIACYATITIVIPYLASIVKKKITNDKYKQLVDNAAEVVSDCVITVNQTYVEALKKEGAFDKDAQEAAFLKCTNYILDLLNDETVKAIDSVYGNIDTWIKTEIEANVNVNKNNA